MIVHFVMFVVFTDPYILILLHILCVWALTIWKTNLVLWCSPRFQGTTKFMSWVPRGSGDVDLYQPSSRHVVLYTTSTNVLHGAGDVDLYEAPCLFVCPYYALRVLHGSGYADLYETPCLIILSIILLFYLSSFHLYCFVYIYCDFFNVRSIFLTFVLTHKFDTHSLIDSWNTSKLCVKHSSINRQNRTSM